MPRGQYAVQPGMDVEASKQTGRDNSYRACIHSMLIFIAICIILLVCAWPWNNHKASRTNKDSNMTDPSSEAVKGDENLPSTYETLKTTRTTARPTRYPTTLSTPTTTETIERKVVHAVVPDTTPSPEPSPEEAEDELPHAVVPETTPAPETTTFAVARKPLYTVVAVEESESSTQPGDAASTPADREGVTDDGLVEIVPAITTPREGTTTPREGTTTPREGTTTPQEGTTTPGTDEVEVFSQAASNTHEEHYESSVTTGAPDETEPTDETPTTVSETSTQPETTPLTGVTVLPHIQPANDTSAKSVNPICESSQCKALATRMLTLMNHSVDPCDDFYEYSCGALRFNPSVLGDDPSKDVYERVRRGMESIADDNSCQAHRKFKKYYKSCVEFDAVSKDLRVAEVRRILESVGEIIEVDAVNPVVDTFTSLISKLMLYHSTPLFDLILDVDGHNPSVFALKLTAPVFKPAFRPYDKRDDCMKASLIGDLNQYYEEYTRCKREEHQTYLQELDAALEELKVKKNTITAIRQEMEWNLLDAMNDLPAAGVMQEQLTGKEYELKTISELNKLFPEVEWGVLVQTLLKRSVSDEVPVQVYFTDYLQKMFKKFTDLQPRQQQNVLLAWLAHDLYVDLVLTRDSCTRESYCLRVASDLMEDVSSSLYLSTFKQATLANMRTEAQEVFKQLRSTLEVQLRDAKWLDDASRSAAVSKLKSLTLQVDGGVGVFLNESFLDARMDQIELQDTNYVTLSTSLLQRYRKMMYSLYDVNPSETKAIWSHFLLPYSTQGIVIYALKKVVIPYGLMQKPMYETSLPRYLLMARLGFVIAHEMAHHFDVNGMSYGPNGKGDDLLSDASSTAFGETTSCPKDDKDFQGYHTSDDGRSIKFKANKTLSLNERLADRTAAALSYDAYLSWVRDFEPPQLPYLGLTNDQVYFLAMAQIFCSKTTILDYGVSLFEDEHPPPFLRVNTIVDNSRRFPEVFECKQGVKMNPSADIKCEAFPHLTPVNGEKDFTPYN